MPPKHTVHWINDHTQICNRSEKIEISLNEQMSRIVAALSSRQSAKTIKTWKCKRRARPRAEKARENELENLETEFHAKRDHIVRQAVRAEPGLIEQASAHIENPFVLKRFNEYNSAMQAYENKADDQDGDRRYHCRRVLSGEARTRDSGV